MTEFIVSYDVKIFNSLGELSEQFSQLLKSEVDSEDKKFNLVLSGGSTPRNLFKYLSVNYKDQINWSKINFFWGDERCVPPSSDESNYKMAYDSLLSKLQITDTNIFRIRGEANPLEEAARYSKTIKNNVQIEDDIPKFDLIMLGLGEDGHTASIFPDQMNLIDDKRICSTAVHPVSSQKRITLTGSVINNAKNIVFIVTGKTKSRVVAEILNNEIASKKYPASFVKPVNGKLIWLLDQQAASLFKGN